MWLSGGLSRWFLWLPLVFAIGLPLCAQTSLAKTSSPSGSQILISRATLQTWKNKLDKATLLLQSSQATIKDLQASLQQAQQVTANLQNSLAQAVGTSEASQATTQALKDLLAQSQTTSAALSQRLLEQSKVIDKADLDAKALAFQRNIWKYGMFAAVAVAVGTTVWALVKK